MALPTEFPSSFTQPWRSLLLEHRTKRASDWPNYHQADELDALVATSHPQSLYVGTGLSVYTRAILPAIASAKHSIHFVTCFWAQSESLDALRETLSLLAASRSASPDGDLPVLRMSICFSSRGLFQKLFHTSSKDGHIYSPRDWAKLGLPDEPTLAKGRIELQVKSLFFTPFSVMHPKYVIVDETRAWIPSCNLSWERWFEGCIEVTGPVVRNLLEFHQRTWRVQVNLQRPSTEGRMVAGYELDERPVAEAQETQQDQDADAQDSDDSDQASSSSPLNADGQANSTNTKHARFTSDRPVPTILLPSPHHRNPRFRIFPFYTHTDPPVTPLNAALLTLFANAGREIRIITPNLTSAPVVDALLDALDRGVNVQIRTSKNMMVVEQLLTALTTTAFCLRAMIKKYRKLMQRAAPVPGGQDGLESQPVTPGSLDIYYYKSLESRKAEADEPVLSHFKMIMIDGEYLVLGSGNLDRASWWTSQELGVLFYMPHFEEHRLWESVLGPRGEALFRSADDL